jgi:assimilatory nitrate reductase catalytic subunit
LKIDSGSVITVSSRRAAIEVTAFVTATVQPGQVFIPMHYGEVNELTHPTFDPYSRQPSYKACAVRLTAGSPRSR